MSDYPELPTPDSYLFQHEETGLTQVVDGQQVEWGFENNNPRLRRVGGMFTEMQMRAYVRADRIMRAGWLPIETAPEDGTAIMAFWPTGTPGLVHARCYGLAFKGREGWLSTEDDSPILVWPTHWMPLPTPPKA